MNSADVIIVSGLPRSGTSLMMQMLFRGGLDVVTDNVRTADVDNPRGYFELEAVKAIRQDSSWISNARGKALKMVSLLLYDLPTGERYRVVFVDRDLGEVLASQRKMLARAQKPSGDDNEMRRSFELHLERLEGWLREQANIEVLHVSHKDLIRQPLLEAERVNEFLGGGLDVQQMASAVDPGLYRNRA